MPPYSGRGRPAKYHPECKAKLDKRNYRAKQRAKTVTRKPSNQPVTAAVDALDGRGSMRGGEQYERWVEDGGPQRIDRGASHDDEAARAGVSRVTVTHWWAQYRHDLALAAKRAAWKPHATAAAAKADFKVFRERYFRVARGPMKGQPPATTAFHMRWINAILEAIESGGQLMILSPPRHGKSLLMAHFVIWQIVRNPDIAIIWVAGNENIARRFGSLVRDELEMNVKLRADFCGPGGTFKPSVRLGAQWRDDEFEVATRTTPQPAPTFKAVGRGGRLLSMDADLIVTDDIEDNKTTLQPAQRSQTEGWFNTDLASRKEEHTAWVYIGSRQHPEDLASKLLVSGEWDTIVESAHDRTCTLAPKDEAAHVDCVLWPEVRGYRYLMQKKRTVGDSIYDMQYLNQPRSEGMTMFPRHEIEECRDRSRRLGDVTSLPAGTRLIAGLDPSNKNFTSAILWAVKPADDPGTETRYLVDIENRPGSGLVNMRAILEQWQTRYDGIVGWAIEKNIAEDSLAHDLPLRELIRAKGVRVLHHVTGHNKWDQRHGVPKMADHFRAGRIVLPYGDPETVEKVDRLIDQFVNFTDAVSSHQTTWLTDMVMAAWFPEKEIQLMSRRIEGGMKVEYGAGLSGVNFESMFGRKGLS